MKDLREASKFVLLLVHFLRHFVRPILTRPRLHNFLREISNINKLEQALENEEVAEENGERKKDKNLCGFPAFYAKPQQRKWQRFNDLL